MCFDLFYKVQKVVLTFEHLHRHLCEACWFVFVDSDSFGQNNLTETSFTQRLPQSQPEDDTQTHQKHSWSQNREFKLSFTCLLYTTLVRAVRQAVVGLVPVPRQLPGGIVGELVLGHSGQDCGGGAGEARLSHQTHSRVKRGRGLD